MRLLDCDPLLARAEATFRFDLPRSLERDRRSRHPRTTPCDVTVRLTLAAGCPRVDVETSINNRAFDHRLRVWFPTGLRTGQVFSDGHFMVNQRPLQRTGGDDWVQPAPATWPPAGLGAPCWKTCPPSPPARGWPCSTAACPSSRPGPTRAAAAPCSP